MTSALDVGRLARMTHRLSAPLAAAVLVAALLAGVVAIATPAAASPLPVVSAGANHTCALMPSGQVLCWGDNTYGQLGTGTNIASTVPVPVVGLPPATQIAAGDFHTCAIDPAGHAWCWGNNENGALGNGTNTDSTAPVPVSGNRIFTQLAAGGIIYGNKTSTNHADFTCGVTQNGSIWCWGYGGDGQLGNGANLNSNIPVQVLRPAAKAVQVATGANHACVLLVDNSVWCWGFNAQGELGNNTKTGSNVPVAAIGVGRATAVGAGVYNSCRADRRRRSAVLGCQHARRAGQRLAHQQQDGTPGSRARRTRDADLDRWSSHLRDREPVGATGDRVLG